MKVTRMPPSEAANLVANSGNTIYGVGVFEVILPGIFVLVCGSPEYWRVAEVHQAIIRTSKNMWAHDLEFLALIVSWG